MLGLGFEVTKTMIAPCGMNCQVTIGFTTRWDLLFKMFREFLIYMLIEPLIDDGFLKPPFLT